jgi:hypothetical protein
MEGQQPKGVFMMAAVPPTLALGEIQGNLAGFFKPLQRSVFLRFVDKATAQAFIRTVIREIDGVVAQLHVPYIAGWGDGTTDTLRDCADDYRL